MVSTVSPPLPHGVGPASDEDEFRQRRLRRQRLLREIAEARQLRERVQPLRTKLRRERAMVHRRTMNL